MLLTIYVKCRRTILNMPREISPQRANAVTSRSSSNTEKADWEFRVGSQAHAILPLLKKFRLTLDSLFILAHLESVLGRLLGTTFPKKKKESGF